MAVVELLVAKGADVEAKNQVRQSHNEAEEAADGLQASLQVVGYTRFGIAPGP